MKLEEVVKSLENFAPLEYQDSYDNSGLLIGDREMELTGILCTTDINEDIIHEAIQMKANLIISHHPLIFTGIKNITTGSFIGKLVMKAIRNEIAIYAAHTNLDNIIDGVNSKIGEKLRLKNIELLLSVSDSLCKLVTFVSHDKADVVRNAIFDAGAGNIGEYDQCSYNIEGYGTFRASENTEPYAGEKGKLHIEQETRIEVILPKTSLNNVISSMIKVHPYEEVAYDVYNLGNNYNRVGQGMIGYLDKPIEEKEFLDLVKKEFGCKIIKHSDFLKKKVCKIAICGGSGGFLLNKAIQKNADVFLTGEIKYHHYFEVDSRLLLVETGHFESEKYTKEIFYELLIKKFPKFAVHLSKINTNPVNNY